MASGLISTAYTVPVSPTRRAARTVNQPDPAPISATALPGVIPKMSITRLICNLSSLPGESKIERSPVYGSLVLRCSLGCGAGDCDRAVAHWNCRSRTKTKPRRLDIGAPNSNASLDAEFLPCVGDCCSCHCGHNICNVESILLQDA